MLGIMALAQKEIPKAELSSFDLEVGNDGNDGLPTSLVCRKLSMRDT